MRLRHRLASCLRRLRRREGWSQTKAAGVAGLDPRHYQKIEGAEVAATIDTIESLAAAFGLDASVLLRRVRGAPW